MRVIDKYLIPAAQEGKQKCSNTTDPGACAIAFENCASNSNPDRADDCRNAAIAKYAKASASGGQGLVFSNGKSEGKYQCGNGKNAVKIKFNLGCLGNAYTQSELGPIEDLLFALLRFMSIGVGVLVAGSIIVAGIQYSTSQGNAEVTQSAKNRIQSSVIALLIYVFIFAVLQYLVPGGIFKPGVWLETPDILLGWIR
jgi:hypothetical protein